MINQRLSLVIPRVFPQWVDEAKIIKIFREQQIGIISKVSIIRMPNEMGTNEMGTNEMGTNEKGRKYPIYKAYLYFSVWFETIIAQNFQKRIYGKDKQARVVYDDPWFWTVFENTERLKLSKNDKRLMRLSAEIYKNTLFVQTQQEELARELAKQKQELTKQKQELVEQNNAIQILQDFCIQNGLEIPFWSAKHPPSAEVSSLEALSAATAVACADFVLQDNSDQHMAYNSVPYECAESVLYEDVHEEDAYEEDAYEEDAYEEDAYEEDTYEEDTRELDTYELDQEFGEIFNYDFIPVNSYEADWVTENPYINNIPDQSRLCSYLGGGVQMDEMISFPLYM